MRSHPAGGFTIVLLLSAFAVGLFVGEGVAKASHGSWHHRLLITTGAGYSVPGYSTDAHLTCGWHGACEMGIGGGLDWVNAKPVGRDPDRAVFHKAIVFSQLPGTFHVADALIFRCGTLPCYDATVEFVLPGSTTGVLVRAVHLTDVPGEEFILMSFISAGISGSPYGSVTPGLSVLPRLRLA
jgi:hypothetical protein